MSRTLAQKWQGNPIDNEYEIFASKLAYMDILDLGRVDAIVDDTHVLVRKLDLAQSKIECEVLSIGGMHNTLQSIELNQFVLILLPKTAVNVTEGGVNIRESVFSRNYAKCIPLGVPNNSNPNLTADDMGIVVTGKSYHCNFQDNEIRVQGEDMRVILDTDDNTATLAIKKNVINVTENSVEVVVNGTYDATGALTSSDVKLKLSSEGVEIQSQKFKFDGDVEITGNLTAADGNFTAEV